MTIQMFSESSESEFDMDKNRFEALCTEVNRLINEYYPEEKPYFTSHLYGVSNYCALLALRRRLNTEIAATSGMLHDINQITDGFPSGGKNYHAINGAKQARTLLHAMGCYSEKEVETIVVAISHHSDKENTHSPYDEVLKDADVLHHFLFPIDPISKHETPRYNNLMLELGLL